MPFCPNCGKEVFATDAYCPSCGVQVAALHRPAPMSEAGYQTSRVNAASPKKNTWLAILLSFFFPGLGQYYIGERNKGRWFVVIGAVLALTIIFEIGLVLYPLFWVYNMLDAFLTVRRMSADLV